MDKDSRWTLATGKAIALRCAELTHSWPQRGWRVSNLSLKSLQHAANNAVGRDRYLPFVTKLEGRRHLGDFTISFTALHVDHVHVAPSQRSMPWKPVRASSHYNLSNETPSVRRRSITGTECFLENHRDFYCLNFQKVLSLLYTPSRTAYGVDLVEKSVGIGIS
jgi:hypothetical protein